MTVLDIWLDNELVATVSPKARGKKVVVTYTEEGLHRINGCVRVVSWDSFPYMDSPHRSRL